MLSISNRKKYQKHIIMYSLHENKAKIYENMLTYHMYNKHSVYRDLIKYRCVRKNESF